MKNLHIENSYNTWRHKTMYCKILNTAWIVYQSDTPCELLHRSYFSMYIEWWLHNFGYYVTLPFCRNKAIKNINLRCKDLDLEERK